MTDSELRVRGFRALADRLGPVEAGRFIALVLREPFDYTEWHKGLWADKTIEEIVAMGDRVQEQPGEK
jgi:hypothetical protein